MQKQVAAPDLEPVKLTRSQSRSPLEHVLWSLASLKLTVALMSMAIFLVLAGTVAQVDRDIWYVVREYFRTWWTWIDYSIFFPRSLDLPKALSLPFDIKIPLVFPFPGGFMLGAAMAVNLVAAHAVRFRAQAKGERLYIGCGIIVAGCALTWLVIDRGMHTLDGKALIGFDLLWALMRVAITGLWIGTIYLLTTIRTERYFERYLLVGTGIVLGGLVGWVWFGGIEINPNVMRIAWQLIQSTVAGLVLLMGCAFIFKKRAGIVLLHAGIGLMMANEIVVYGLHEEGVVHIREGSSANYAIDQRNAELAIIDRSPSDHDQVVVVPRSKLEAGGTIQDEQLPFDVEIVEYFINARVGDKSSGEETPADAGKFSKLKILEKPPVSGAAGSAVDIPAAYVKFTDRDGDSLGTYLLSASSSATQKIKVDDDTYDIVLRFKRRYLGYELHLKDFRFDRYLETNTAKNFSSLVRIVDEGNGVDREVMISMNNPLRYRGTTFYQSDWDKEDEKGTYLQAVSNTGWMVPYVGCMIVAIGMLAQFGITLLRFLRRRDKQFTMSPITTRRDKQREVEEKFPASKDKKGSAKSTSSTKTRSGTDWGIIISVVIAALCGLWLLNKARGPQLPDDEMAIHEFGKLPVIYGGRVQPMDTLARTSLRIVSNKQEFVDKYDEKQPAIRWLLDFIADRRAFREHNCLRIDHPEILKRLGLERRKGYLYSMKEFAESADTFYEMIDEVRDKERKSEEFDVVDKRITELKVRFNRIELLTACFHTTSTETKEAFQFEQERRLAFKGRNMIVSVPKQGTNDEWVPYSYANFDQDLQDQVKNVAREMKERGNAPPNVDKVLSRPSDDSVLKLRAIFAAYEAKNASQFEAAIDDYREHLKSLGVDWEPKRTDFEAWMGHFAPFYHSAALYVLAFILVAFYWLSGIKSLNGAAFALLLLTLIIHTLALTARIYISGRPPVTNLYSSALFIGWGCVLVGLVIEAIYRMGIGNAVAAATGFGSLVVAHMLTTEVASHRGDTIGVLQAVLDTNFWLATHVTIITMGYATTFLAGALGISYVTGGHGSTRVTAKVRAEIGRMIYGTVCFSLFFSFVGTVLGGLWADDSWGRFWGWDPKENGALIIVLWNAIVLHARWDGMVRDRGMAVLAIGGNIVTAWSWFGVNELGAGLHSYGFTEGVALVLAVFMITQLIWIGVGCIPTDRWQSFKHEAEEGA